VISAFRFWEVSIVAIAFGGPCTPDPIVNLAGYQPKYYESRRPRTRRLAHLAAVHPVYREPGHLLFRAPAISRRGTCLSRAASNLRPPSIPVDCTKGESVERSRGRAPRRRLRIGSVARRPLWRGVLIEFERAAPLVCSTGGHSPLQGGAGRARPCAQGHFTPSGAELAEPSYPRRAASCCLSIESPFSRWKNRSRPQGHGSQATRDGTSNSRPY